MAHFAGEPGQAHKAALFEFLQLLVGRLPRDRIELAGVAGQVELVQPHADGAHERPPWLVPLVDIQQRVQDGDDVGGGGEG